jgi:alpha-beta hydrolase superfamily lysophospholipase
MKQLNLSLASQTPALILFPDKTPSKGTILFYHGLKACKETGLKELTSLASRGFIAVGIDNVGHGERAYDEDRIHPFDTYEEFFLDMVKKTALEIPEIVDDLVKRGWGENFGVSGISMGGYIAYSSVIQEPRIKAVAPILGSPCWKTEDSPHNHPDRFYPVALLAQNAGKDEAVPARYSREFCEKLKHYYKNDKSRLCYTEFPDSGHFMQENEWNELWENTLLWFDKFLSKE